MDANTLRKIIEARIAQFEGNAFQDMSDRLGSVLFPDDYHPVRPGGRHGDTKNDGYCPKARVFFAAHATRGESAEKSKAKIEGDLEGCLRQHRDVKVWRFLTNDTLIGEVDQFIDNTLRLRHPKVTIEIWGHKRLADEISALEHADIEKILDLNLPAPNSPKAETVSAVSSVVIAILLDLNMYEEKQFNPQLQAMEMSAENDRRQVESLLGTVKRILGKNSVYYIELEKVSSEIHAALAVEHVIDGGISHNKRLNHFKQAYDAAYRLLCHIRDNTSVKVSDLESSLTDIPEQTYRWLKSIDYTLAPFFDEAADYARQLLRIHLVLILAGSTGRAKQYKDFADEIEKLSWGTSNTDYMQVQDNIPDLALRARNLSLANETTISSPDNGTAKSTHAQATPQKPLPYVYITGVFGGNGHILRFSACRTFNLSEDFIIPERITLLGRTINFGDHPPIKAGESIQHTGIDDLEYPSTDEERFVETFFMGRNGQCFVARQKMSYEPRQDGKFNINGLSRPVVEPVDENQT